MNLSGCDASEVGLQSEIVGELWPLPSTIVAGSIPARGSFLEEGMEKPSAGSMRAASKWYAGLHMRENDVGYNLAQIIDQETCLPDLIEALININKWAESILVSQGNPHWDEVRAAIAKAKGGS